MKKTKYIAFRASDYELKRIRKIMIRLEMTQSEFMRAAATCYCVTIEMSEENIKVVNRRYMPSPKSKGSK